MKDLKEKGFQLHNETQDELAIIKNSPRDMKDAMREELIKNLN